MEKLVGLKLLDDDRLYYVNCNIDNISVGTYVIAHVHNCLRYALVSKLCEKIDKKDISVGDVIRIANDKDKKENEKNIEESARAFEKCRKLVEKNKLDMRLIKAEFTFDRSVLMIYFFSMERVDFRELAKQMAATFKTRIEFRQVGIRDKARIVGGIGPCGRKLCCSTFLYDFDSISISMAKNQMLALNPTKINGVCGRLLCCLNYEDETYLEFRKNMPNVGKKLTIDGKSAKVVQIDLYNQKYVVEFEDKTQKVILVDEDGTDK